MSDNPWRLQSSRAENFTSIRDIAKTGFTGTKNTLSNVWNYINLFFETVTMIFIMIFEFLFGLFSG